jgi:hypothetical protein
MSLYAELLCVVLNLGVPQLEVLLPSYHVPDVALGAFTFTSVKEAEIHQAHPEYPVHLGCLEVKTKLKSTPVHEDLFTTITSIRTTRCSRPHIRVVENVGGRWYR